MPRVAKVESVLSTVNVAPGFGYAISAALDTPGDLIVTPQVAGKFVKSQSFQIPEAVVAHLITNPIEAITPALDALAELPESPAKK